MTKILISSLLLLFSPLVFANNWYQVELIVFEHLQINDDGELWKSGYPPYYNFGIELVESTDSQLAFKQQPLSSYKLINVRNTLASSSAYLPLHHTAWQQPSLSKSQAKQVYIEDPAAKIAGVVTLTAGTLLHIDLDLSYLIDFIPSDLAEPIIMDRRYTQLREKRQIKLNELHYFDNPLFGVIVQVTRLAIP